MTNTFFKRPISAQSAQSHIEADRIAFNEKWQQSKFHCDTSPAIRALIASIHDQMGRLKTVLEHEVKAELSAGAIYLDALEDARAEMD